MIRSSIAILAAMIFQQGAALAQGEAEALPGSTSAFIDIFGQKAQATILKSASLRAAIARGDARAVVAMGGTPLDATAALLASNIPDAMHSVLESFQAASSIEYINDGGMAALMATYASGATLTVPADSLGPPSPAWPAR